MFVYLWWWFLPFANGFNYSSPITFVCNFQVRVEAIDNGDRNRKNRVTVSVIIKYNDTNQHHPAIDVNQTGMWTVFISPPFYYKFSWSQPTLNW